MIPAALTTTMGLRRPLLEKVRDYIVGRVSAELSELTPVTIDVRIKSNDSIYQKLQTGKYSMLSELDDLIGLKVVMLYRHQVLQAQRIIAGCGLAVVKEFQGRSVQQTDFKHREPKLSVLPPDEYRARNSDTEGIATEIQFTTALQHALDMATHKFDYKGSSYEWENFRLVAQLRGMLELADTILDDLDKARMPSEVTLDKPMEFAKASVTLSAITSVFPPEALPSDLRRMTDTVIRWLDAISLRPEDFSTVLSQHTNLVAALSIDPQSAILGALLRENATDLIGHFDGQFCISAELATLCEETSNVPSDRRVSFD